VGDRAKKIDGAEAKGRLALDERLPLRVGLGSAFAGVIGYARAMAAEVQQEPVRAVHEYRKALRRARAVVRLSRPLMGEGGYRSLVHDLRVALRGTSPLRDAAVLLQTLALLPDEDKTRPARKALTALLEAEPSVAGAPEVELRRSLQIVVPLPARFLAFLPESLRWRELRAGLERSYRRTRRARKSAFRSREDADVHAFRKRVKELRYQLELLDATGVGKPRRDHRALALLAETLGEVTDLTLLRRCARLRQEEFGGARPQALLAALDAAIDARLEALSGTSRKVFERSAREFAARAVRSFH